MNDIFFEVLNIWKCLGAKKKKILSLALGTQHTFQSKLNPGINLMELGLAAVVCRAVYWGYPGSILLDLHVGGVPARGRLPPPRRRHPKEWVCRFRALYPERSSCPTPLGEATCHFPGEEELTSLPLQSCVSIRVCCIDVCDINCMPSLLQRVGAVILKNVSFIQAPVGDPWQTLQ